MPESRSVQIRIDNRTRLVSAALAATNYPDKSQERQKHGVTLHARGTRKWVSEFTHHPAVSALQILLNQNVPLEPIFGYALRLSWPGLEIDDAPRWVPPRWHEQLRHFQEVTKLAEWWQNEDDQWQSSLRHLIEIFGKVDFYKFLMPFFGTMPEQLVFLPNLSYPTDHNVAVHVSGELAVIIPPRKAWGDSAPWPYDNDPVYIYQEALRGYIKLLMSAELRSQPELIATLSERPLPVGEKFTTLHPKWTDQLTALFTAGAIACFLEDAIDARESKAFSHMMQKVEGLTLLPGVISLLKRYQDEKHGGKYSTFIEYLPVFVKQLRVARTIGAL
jgi:hypothetical protein